MSEGSLRPSLFLPIHSESYCDSARSQQVTRRSGQLYSREQTTLDSGRTIRPHRDRSVTREWTPLQSEVTASTGQETQSITEAADHQ